MRAAEYGLTIMIKCDIVNDLQWAVLAAEVKQSLCVCVYVCVCVCLCVCACLSAKNIELECIHGVLLCALCVVPQCSAVQCSTVGDVLTIPSDFERGETDNKTVQYP